MVTTTLPAITLNTDDRRTVVYAEGRGVLGRIVPVGHAFSATLYAIGTEPPPVRFFSTHQPAVAAFRYGF